MLQLLYIISTIDIFLDEVLTMWSDELFSHYIQFHHINKTNYHFKESFEPDGNSSYEKKSYRCNQTSDRRRDLNHNFFKWLSVWRSVSRTK